METDSARNYQEILTLISTHASKHDVVPPQLVVVSKTFGIPEIQPVIEAGARVFGENRVQEAQGKWPQLKHNFPDIELHLIGPLQSNKTADAVSLFDCIQSIDREKIARSIAAEMKKQERDPSLFVQVNTGNEPQKAGISSREVTDFLKFCNSEVGIFPVGLMCIPPFDANPGPHFALLRKLAEENGLEKLSMGMSSDYLTAVEFGATHVRVGSAIFGARTPVSNQNA